MTRRWQRSRAEGLLTDEHLRAIENSGRLQLEEDEALDLAEAREEERRFWEETWDEADEEWSG